MNTKSCPGCGWVFPSTHPDPRCRFCNTKFEVRLCRVCGELKNTKGRTVCIQCVNKDQRAYKTKYEVDRGYSARRYRESQARHKASLDAWLLQISKVQMPLKTLTEEQWLEACRHFGKCAYCSAEEITARSFFIPFNMGGRYAAWNILPVCEKCATTHKQMNNPFTRYSKDRMRYFSSRYADKDCLERIVEYLQSKMKEVMQDVPEEGRGI